MSSQEFGGKYAKKKPPWWKPFLPLLGLLLLVIFGVVSFVLSGPVAAQVDAMVTQRALPMREMQIISGIAIFIVQVFFVAMIYAIFQPKGPKGVTERELDREKREMLKEQQAANRRKKEMLAKMRARNKSINER
jgi:uncharacterized membrane protein